ncbi:unnamed protein product, partial [Durusdinium trenchii]
YRHFGTSNEYSSSCHGRGICTAWGGAKANAAALGCPGRSTSREPDNLGRGAAVPKLADASLTQFRQLLFELEQQYVQDMKRWTRESGLLRTEMSDLTGLSTQKVEDLLREDSGFFRFPPHLVSRPSLRTSGSEHTWQSSRDMGPSF